MEYIGILFSHIVAGMQHEVNIYGYDISLWQIYLFYIVASVLALLLGGIFSGD